MVVKKVSKAALLASGIGVQGQEEGREVHGASVPPLGDVFVSWVSPSVWDLGVEANVGSIGEKETLAGPATADLPERGGDGVAGFVLGAITPEESRPGDRGSAAGSSAGSGRPAVIAP